MARDAASPPTERVVAVLELLATGDAKTSSEVARSLHLSGSTTAAILATLDSKHYVERQPDKSYRLGVGLLRLITALGERFPFFGAGAEEVSRLARECDCGCALSRIGEDHLEVILAVGTEQLGIAPGQRFPLDPPWGDYAMAWRSEAEIADWLDQTPGGLSKEEREQRQETIMGIRARGYAVYGIEPDVPVSVRRMHDLLVAAQGETTLDPIRNQLTRLASIIGGRPYTDDELMHLRRFSVGYVIAPIFGPDGQPHYEIALQIMRSSMKAEDLHRRVAKLRLVAQTLAVQIGGR